MKILFVSSECAPFSKSGGLADVAFSLPPALQKTGDDMAIVTPMYRVTQENCGDQFELVKTCSVALGQRSLACTLYRGALNGVPVYAIGNEHLFHRPRLYGYGDDSLRFAFFCRAVIDLLPEFGALPDILHCNDWETALAILYLKNDAVLRPELSRIKTVYTIHNIAYQGQFGKSEMESTFALPSGWYHGGLSYEFEGRQDINLMKGAMLMADAVTTVSPTYARELHYPYFAHGLQGVVDLVDHKLYGILNGIDVAHYNPESDPLVPYHFTIEDRTGKARCKREIQRLFGLNQESEWPLLASVARLVEQKGIELIREILPQLMDMDVNTALTACADWPVVRQRLTVLQELGLGYLTLGEETPGLSGGEAQRLKLASEMGKAQSDSLFVFDEPTIGLHPADVQVLLGVFQTLIEHGATVIVIEHDLDVIRNADYIIDMGPGGGAQGGTVVAAGTPDVIRHTPASQTGKFI